MNVLLNNQARNVHHRVARSAYALFAAVVLALAACAPGDDPTSSQSSQPAQGTRSLPIAPIAQQTEVWCWAASAEMVFRHFGLPQLNPAGNYQCGIVAAYYGPNSACWFNCFACVSAIGPISNAQILINGYGQVARQFTTSRVLTSTLVFSGLTFNDTAREIDEGRPIIAGISPSGYSYPNLSQHLVVVVGYQNQGGIQAILVNDPFPYEAFPASPNPYFLAGATRPRPGQYLVPYAAMINR